ncbi:hypothetical protein A3SAC12_0037 [Lactobacillus phage 3-SAC12]|nr:hypothetical protein A3SAC12_0037 [Lactobacillus phage 3-SAC12]
MSERNYIDDLLAKYGRATERHECSYCHKNFPLVDSNGLEIRVVYGDQMIVKSQGKDTAVTIRYCPMCGRKIR